jgi:hypothetical protein
VRTENKFKSLPAVVVVVAWVKNRLWQWPEMIVVTEHDGVVVVKNRLRQWPEMIVVTEHDGVVAVARDDSSDGTRRCCGVAR